MATLSIGLSGSAVVTGSKNYTVSDADITSLLAWAKVAYDPYTSVVKIGSYFIVHDMP